MKNKKALFIDLDNTIYPAASIGEKLFDKLYKIIATDPYHSANIEEIKQAILRKPFHHVASTFNMDETLYKEALEHLTELEYNEPMQLFPDYSIIRNLNQKKYLITTGFTKLQQSKVVQLGIKADFEEIHIMDFTKSTNTKAHAFKKIMADNNYTPKDVLVIGDDPESEIKAGQELDIDCILYDSLNLFENRKDLNRITNFNELIPLMN